MLWANSHLKQLSSSLQGIFSVFYPIREIHKEPSVPLAHPVFSVAAEPTVQPEIDVSSVESRNTTVRWRLPPNNGVNAGTASGFLVQLFGPPPNSEKLLEETTLLTVLSKKFHNLEYQKDYTVVVCLINCGSQGPPSKPYHFRLSSQGN